MKICSVCDRCFEDSEAICFEHGELSNGPHSVDTVHGYLIKRLITSSPNAVIYQAQQSEHGRECVISIVDGDSTQFLSDAGIAAGLFHAGVAGVVESGELSNGAGFAVFEGFGGTSLFEVLAEGTLSLLDRIRIARQAAEAVHAIHSAGLLHGALRPVNISIEGIDTDRLSVKVHNIDLGSAIANGMLSNRFSMDSSLDPLRYFAPERFRGEEPTAQSDVYSLGILLYELLSGHPPFEASSAAALADMHLNQKPPEIKIENFDLRMLLTHTLSESLQKQTSLRQSTADLFARQMRHIEQLATHVSTPPPAVAVAATPSPISRPIALPYVHPEPRPAARSAIEVVAPTVFNDDVFEEQAVPVRDPIAYAPPTPKRSRLRGMKKRLHSHLSDLKADVRPIPTIVELQEPAEDEVCEDLTAIEPVFSFQPEEEITLARPPVERIEVSWDEPQPADIPLAADYFPGLISDRQDADSQEGEDSMFAGFQARGRGVGRVPVYAAAACGFILISFGVYKLGSIFADPSDGYIGETRSVSAQAMPGPIRADLTEPTTPETNTTAAPVEIPADPIDIPTTAEAKAKPKITAVSEPPKRAQTESSQPVSIRVREPVKGDSPIVPSTLVITRGPGRPKTTVVTERTTSTNGGGATGSGATRPRIVTIPD